MKSACETCPAGFYGADPNRLICEPGTPGYVFELGATVARPLNVTTEHGYICPTGAYCPAKSTKPLLCPIGSYQPSLGQGNSSSCLLCQPGNYQFEAGQASCLRCSSSSVSSVGAPVCTCVGKNRGFQPGDGMCICAPGYEFVDSNLVVSSESDGMYVYIYERTV
jgi:hypothetical protein